MSGRRAVRPVVLAAATLGFAAALAACGDAPTAPAPPDASPGSAAPQHDARRAARPAPPDEVALAVDRLADAATAKDAEPDDAAQRKIVADLAALGAPGLERLLARAAAAPDDDALRSLVGDVVDALGLAALDALVPAIRDGGGSLRRIAVNALRDAFGEIDTWPFLPVGRDVAAAVVAATGDDTLRVRLRAFEILRRAGPTGVAIGPAIGARLTSADDEEVAKALDALQMLGPYAADAAPAVARLLDSPVEDFRDQARQVLAAIGAAPPETVARFVAMLRSSDPFERGTAAWALAAWPAAAASSIRDIAALAADETTRRDAADALHVAIESPEVARALCAALREMPPNEAAAVLDAVAGWDERVALHDAAVALLASEDADVRAAAARVASPIDGETSWDPAPFRPLLGDPDERVRAVAAAALVARDPGWRDRALTVARAALGSDATRATAIHALLAASDPAKPSAAVAPLLADADGPVRRNVIDFLARSGAPLGEAPAGVLDAVATDALRGDPVVGEMDRGLAVALRFDGGGDAVARAAGPELSSGDDARIQTALTLLERAGPAARAAAPAVEGIASRTDLSPTPASVLAALTGDVAELAARFRWDHAVDDARRLLSFGDVGAAALVRAAARLSAWNLHEVIAEFAGNETISRAVLAAAGRAGDGDDAIADRRGAATLAAVLGSAQAVPLLATLVGDGDSGVCMNAQYALCALGRRGADISPATDALRALVRAGSPLACVAARHVPALAPDLRSALASDEVSVRYEAAAGLLGIDPTDGDARRALFDVLGHVSGGLAHDDDRPLEEALGRIALTAADVPAIVHAMLAIEDHSTQRILLHALARLGPESAAALPTIRLALQDDLPCIFERCPPLTPDAIAALAAMGPAAAPAVPDLRALALRDAANAAAARATIARIESAPR